MSQDGKPQIVPKTIKRNRPITNEHPCSCGGTYYAAPGAPHARCSGGEMRCTRCLREAGRFGKGWTCGPGCAPATRAAVLPARPRPKDDGYSYA